MYILVFLVNLVYQGVFCQINEKDTLYIMMEENDTLIRKGKSPSGEAFYYLYSEEEIEEKQRLLEKYNGILPEGFCEYYYFSSYDKGVIVNKDSLRNEKIYSRRELIKNGLGTHNIYSIEKLNGNYLTKKLFFDACE